MIDVRKWEILLAVIGVTLVGAGVFWWKGGGNTQPEVEIITESETAGVTVDVSGAVVKPGVYQLNAQSRVEEALTAAGGLTSEADLVWVDKNVNRSAKLVDGAKIYIPPAGEQSGLQIRMSQEQVNLNSASQSELEELPGIGPVTAEKIISARPYMRPEELIELKILTRKVWDQIQDKISLW